LEDCQDRYKELILPTLSYIRLVYTGYVIYSIVLLKNGYKEFNAETEKDKLVKA